jgi:hypothetical protein
VCSQRRPGAKVSVNSWAVRRVFYSCKLAEREVHRKQSIWRMKEPPGGKWLCSAMHSEPSVLLMFVCVGRFVVQLLLPHCWLITMSSAASH